MAPLFRRPLLVSALLALHLLAVQRVVCATKSESPSTAPPGDNEEPEPPFPELVNWSERRLKIVSEIIETDSNVGAQTQEEYLDLNAGQAAFVLTSQSGYRVKFVDADEGLAFTYRPYKCRVERISDIPIDIKVTDSLGGPDAPQVWNYNTHVCAAPECDSAQAACKRQGARDMRLFGVSALWLEASDKPKRFARAEIIYSATKNVNRASLLWTYHDERHNLDIKFYFIVHSSKSKAAPANGGDGDGDGPPVPPSLEMIKIESPADEPSGRRAELLRTINILSIDRVLEDEVRESLLSVPLGFGCFSSLSDDLWSSSTPALAEEVRQRRSHAALNGGGGGDGASGDARLWEGHAELEVTATRYEHGQQGAQTKRTSDTYSVEVAQASVRGYGLKRGQQQQQQQQEQGQGDTQQDSQDDAHQTHVKLVRWRNTREDRKLVMHHTFQVQFALDMRRGTCELSHMAPPGEQAALVRFKNGLHFDANVELFTDSDDLHFIKESAGGPDKRGLSLHYYEGTAGVVELRAWLAANEASWAAGNLEAKARTRVIRAYEVHEYDDPAAVAASGAGASQLRSVTIWVLDDTESRIVESYQIYVINSRKLEPQADWLEKARLFDVGRECFLENERMLQNRDYAWVTRTYPAPARLLELIGSSQREMKEIYYSKFMGDFTRAPKVEILLEDDAFKVRSLLLDVPPLELLYERAAGMMLTPDFSAGDLDLMAPDLAHCAHLCQLNQCNVISFCERAHTCFVSARQVHGGAPTTTTTTTLPRVNLTSVSGCDAYVIPKRLETSQLHRLGRLVNVLASLRHQEYGPAPAGMPGVPDEVSLPPEESGLTEVERRVLLTDYLDKLNAWLEDNNRLPSSAFVLYLAGHLHLLLPSKFELEADPLDEFSLHATSDSAQELAELDGPGRLPVFHRGLGMFRYNPARAPARSTTTTTTRPDRGATEPTTSGGATPPAPAPKVQFQTMRGLSYDQCALACWDSKCGSFSHCDQARECILSNINSTSRARALDLLEQDPDCFVAQRDFLGNFVKFENVFRPQVYKASELEPSGDPSECALNCVARTDFRCLGFEYCQRDTHGAGQCFYQTERHLLESSLAPPGQGAIPGNRTGCDHYARSALADFLRLDAREVTPRVLAQLKTSTFAGLSVFRCAEKCASELADCTGFQFCHAAPLPSDSATFSPTDLPQGAGVSGRLCTTIESKVTADMLAAGDNSTLSPPPSSGAVGAAGSETGNVSSAEETTVVDERADGEIVHAGRYLKFSVGCQVFTMREDTAEAHLRDLAFGELVHTARDQAAREAVARGRAASSRPLTLFAGFLLYLTVVVVSATLACLVILIKDNRDLVLQRWRRLRMAAGSLGGR